MSQWHLRQAARVVNAGGVIAYPTEAVFGLGCDPFDPVAVHRLLAIKHRPESKGLIVVASGLPAVQPLLQPLTSKQQALLNQHWPGPFTFTIPCLEAVPRWLRGDFDSLAVRVSANPTVQALCAATGGLLVSTSANLSGQPALRHYHQVNRRLGRWVDYVVPGSTDVSAQPSTIISLHTGKTLRRG